MRILLSHTVGMMKTENLKAETLKFAILKLVHLNFIFHPCLISREKQSTKFWNAALTILGFPGGSLLKEFTCQWKRRGLSPWVGKIPCRRQWRPLQCPCLEKPMDRGLAGHSPWGCRVRHAWATKERQHWMSFTAETGAVGQHGCVTVRLLRPYVSNFKDDLSYGVSKVPFAPSGSLLLCQPDGYFGHSFQHTIK